MGTRIAESRRELAVGAPNSYAGIEEKPKIGSKTTFEQGAIMQDNLWKTFKLKPSYYGQLIVSCTGDQLFLWKKVSLGLRLTFTDCYSTESRDIYLGMLTKR